MDDRSQRLVIFLIFTRATFSWLSATCRRPEEGNNLPTGDCRDLRNSSESCGLFQPSQLVLKKSFAVRSLTLNFPIS